MSKTSYTQPKVIVVCGPTATGKSDYAVTLARQLNQQAGAEIVSADSRQIYRGLNIGSGKITKKEMHGIPHHMLDIANPKRTFSVAEYQKIGTKILREIIARGKIPIICGGTGFYIDALLGLAFPEVKPNKKLREKLSVKSTDALFTLLAKKDPERANAIDRHNRVRLIRALEIIDALGKVPPLKRISTYDVQWKYLDFPDDTLKERIHTRLLKRFKQGMIREVRELHFPKTGRGVSWKQLESFGLEYKYVALYLQNKLTKEEMLRELELAIWHYAKRQRTWFKKYSGGR